MKKMFEKLYNEYRKQRVYRAEHILGLAPIDIDYIIEKREEDVKMEGFKE